MFTRRRLSILGISLLIAVAGGGLMYRHHKRYKHLAIHDPGMVYRSAWLEPDVFREIIEKYQIRTVLNLCEPNELGEQRCLDQRAAVRGSGTRLVEMPMPAATIDPADPAIGPFVELLGDPTNYPLLVRLIPATQVGVYTGIKTTFESIAIPASVFVTGSLINAFGYRSIFFVLVAAILAALAILATVRVPTTQPEEGDLAPLPAGA